MCARASSHRPPRSRPQLVDGARGARNCVPKKVKVARGAVTPSAQSADFVSPSFLLGASPKDPRHAPPASAARSEKNQNAKKRGRAAADQAATTTVAAAVNSRAPTQPTHHTRAPLQDFADVRSRMAMESQRQQRHAAAASHHSADSGSSVFLLRVRIYRIRLRQRCLIIATRPRPVCSESTVVPLSPLDRIPV